MSTQLTFRSLEVYNISKKLVSACYELAARLPAEESGNIGLQLRSAAFTAYVNIARGAFLHARKKRRKMLLSAQNALIVIDAASEVLIELRMVKEEELTEMAGLLSTCYQMVDQLLKIRL